MDHHHLLEAAGIAAGFIYDRAGDYQLAWWLGAGANALALILLAFARPPAPAEQAPAA